MNPDSPPKYEDVFPCGIQDPPMAFLSIEMESSQNFTTGEGNELFSTFRNVRELSLIPKGEGKFEVWSQNGYILFKGKEVRRRGICICKSKEEIELYESNESEKLILKTNSVPLNGPACTLSSAFFREKNGEKRVYTEDGSFLGSIVFRTKLWKRTFEIKVGYGSLSKSYFAVSQPRSEIILVKRRAEDADVAGESEAVAVIKLPPNSPKTKSLKIIQPDKPQSTAVLLIFMIILEELERKMNNRRRCSDFISLFLSIIFVVIIIAALGLFFEHYDKKLGV